METIAFFHFFEIIKEFIRTTTTTAIARGIIRIRLENISWFVKYLNEIGEPNQVFLSSARINYIFVAEREGGTQSTC